MKGRKAIFWKAVGVVTWFALLGTLAASAEAQQPLKLRVGSITGEPTQIPGVWAASKEGYYKDEGIEPVFAFHANGPLVLQSMAAGDIDVASSTAIPVMFQAIAGGMDLVYVASTLKNNAALLARSEIKTVKDLDGKRVGTPGIGTIQDTLLGVFEKQHGIRVKHVYGRMPDLITYLEKGEIEATAGWFPSTEIARRKIGGVYLAKVIMPGAESVGIIFPRAFVQKRPDVVKGFLKATLRGLQYYQKNREAYTEWAAKRENVELDVVRTILFDGQFILTENPIPDRPSTKVLIRASRDAGKIPKEKIPNDAAIDAWMAQHIDDSFLQAAMKEVGWKPQ